MKTKHTKTEKVLIAMLKENTGIALMDSGGDSGRHWQRNQGRDFDNELESVLTCVSGWSHTVTSKDGSE